MRLYYLPASPFARKVRLLAAETGLDRRIELVKSDPYDPASGLDRINPLCKVPALETDEGEVLYDSPVICEYLDSLHERAKLFPEAGALRWRALKTQALADGITEAGVLCRMESLRPPELRSRTWVATQQEKAARGLDALEREAEALDEAEAITIGEIAVACALGWLDFRKPMPDWREGRPGLLAWFERFSARPSMQATMPEA